MSNLNYNQFKNHALAHQPISLRVSLSEIEFLNSETLRVRGNDIKMTKGALSNMANILKLPKMFINEFEKIISTEPRSGESLPPGL